MEVVVEEGIRAQLTSRVAEEIGVLIGRIDVTSKTCFVYCLVPTPAPSPGKNGLPCEEWWVEDHAQQVWDLLPGGVNVIGLYLMSAALKKNVAVSLKKIISQLCQPRWFMSSSLPSRLLMMHISAANARCSFTCQCLSPPYDAAEFAETMEIVFRSLPSLHCLEATVQVKMDSLVDVSFKQPFHEIQKKLVAGLERWRSGVVVMGSRCCVGDDCVVDCVQEKSTQCLVYPKHEALQCGQSKISDKATSLSVCGSVGVLAYVPVEATLTEASTAVTDDVVQAVVIQWMRLYDDVKLEKRKITDKWGGQPQRMKAAVDGWMFNLCGYRFPDESEEDMCERIGELLGVSKESVHLIPALEQNINSPTNYLPPWRYIVAAGLVPLAAILTSLYFWTVS